MSHYHICCIGHITADKVITTHHTAYLNGGTAFYFSSALQHFDLHYLLVTALAEKDMEAVTHLRQKGITVQVQPSAHTVEFENSYGHNPDHRTQRVPQKADPFTLAQLENITADIFHLGPLLADDISVELIQELAARGKVALDVQGYLRRVKNQQVIPTDWPDKQQTLPYVHTLKTNDHELAVLTSQTDLHEGARMLAAWGVHEVVITLGSAGSLIYTNGSFYNIPAYPPARVVDATGCGDTYMAGYLYQRHKGTDIQQAGHFAAAMASLKIEVSGAFEGNEEEVWRMIR